MESTSFRDRVKEMDEAQLREALNVIATALDLSTTPTVFELYHLFW